MHGKRYTNDKVRVEVLKMARANPDVTRMVLAEATGIPYHVIAQWDSVYRKKGQAIYRRSEETAVQWNVRNAKTIIEIESVEPGYRLQKIEEYLKEECGIYTPPTVPAGVVNKTRIPGGRIFFFGSTTLDEQNRIITECLSLSDRTQTPPQVEPSSF